MSRHKMTPLFAVRAQVLILIHIFRRNTRLSDQSIAGFQTENSAFQFITERQSKDKAVHSPKDL